MTTRLKEILEQSGSIVFFGGAGVSTESGIPDFRSESGLYRAQKVYGHSPEELLSHHFFMEHTADFFAYYKENLLYPGAEPNSAHCGLAKLEQMGKLTAVITQNIDGLHQLAGSNAVFELHGSVLRNYCTSCGARYSLDYILSPDHCRDEHGVPGLIPHCDLCGGIVRPDVVLYEESLDDTVMSAAIEAVAQADTMIVGGTSLVVYPAAGLLHYFHGKKLVLINRSPTSFDHKADLVIHDSIGKVISEALA